MTLQEWCGNGLADSWAKAGCAAAIAVAPVAAFHSAWTVAIAWYRWVARFAPEWGASDIAPHAAAPTRPPQTPPTRACHQSHELWRNDETAWCRTCGSEASWPVSDALPRIFRIPCRGNMADRCKSRGRERAVPPIGCPVDDGRLSFDFLKSRVARPLTADEYGENTISNPPLAVPVVDESNSDLGLQVCLDQSCDEEYSEDPFGHMEA